MQNRSIMMIADNAEMTSAVTAAVAQVDGLELDICAGTLGSVNGTAIGFLDRHDLVIFQLSDAEDIETVRHLRREAGPTGRLLALDAGNISLAEARSLRKAGVDEVLPFPIGRDELVEQLDRLATPASALPALYDEAGARLGQVIAVCPARGGLGATTLSVNLAGQLLDTRGRLRRSAANEVAIVDLDLQFGAVATALDLAPSQALFRMAQSGTIPDATFLAQSMQRHGSGLDVLAAPESLMPVDALDRGQIEALIAALRDRYDYTLIDMPRNLTGWTGTVISNLDRLFLVTDTTVPAIRQAKRMIDAFTQERLDLEIVVVVAHETRPLLGARHIAEAEKLLDRKFGHWLPADQRAARSALDRGTLLSDISPRAPLTRAIRTLGRHLIQETTHASHRARGNI